MRMREIYLAWAAGACLAHSTVSAQSPYTLDLPIDIPLLGLGAASSVAGFVGNKDLPICAPYCPSSEINVIDRNAIHFHSDAAGAAADYLLPVLFVVPAVLDAFDSHMHGWWTDIFIFVQTVLLTEAIGQMTKFAVHRDSPALYGGQPSTTAVHDSDAARSFFSTHTASAFAVTTSFTVTYWLRHPDDPMRFIILALGAALSLTTGVLKVAAGAHFWTDVAAGAVVGASMGVLVPLLHVRSRDG
jgi:membrane-associated phospholipid phosphatase